MKCASWKGDTFMRNDDCKNKKGETVRCCFRAYKTRWHSFRDHSNLINKKYKSLFKYGNDYEKWAYGLKRIGYATSKDYPQKLIRIVEQHHLYRYDD